MKFNRTLNPIGETLGLIYVSLHYDAIKKELIQAINDLGINGAEFYQKNTKIYETYVQAFMKLRKQLNNEHYQELREKEPFFFEDENIDFLTVLLSVLLRNTHWQHEIDTISENTLRKEIICDLVNGISLPQLKGTQELIAFLDALDIDQGCKWKLLKLLQSPQLYFKQLIQILEYHLPLYQQAYSAIQEQLIPMLSDYEKNIGNAFSDLMHTISKDQEVTPQLVFPFSQLVSYSGGYYGLLSSLLIGVKQPEWVRKELLLKLKSLGDKSKFEILESLKKEPKCNIDLADILHLTPATISYHMNTLITCNLVKIKKENAKLYYCISEDGIQSIIKDLRNILL